MPYQDKHFEQQIKVPATWTITGIAIFIAIVSILMMVGDRRAEVTAKNYGARSSFDQVSPASQIIAAPAHIIGDSGNWLGDYFFAVKQNRSMKARLAELSKYQDLYKQVKATNERYERLLNLRTEPAVEMVGARSILVSRGPFNNNRLIDAGSDKKIRFGNPVITDQGLVGRVVGVSPHVSRVLMVTDVISRIPIMVARSDARAMMIGDGGDYPRLDFVRGKGAIQKGDQILSSGDGGIFPRGLPIGEAVKGLDGVWRAKLYANRAPIDFVKVLLFEDFSQFPNADEVLKSPEITAVLPAPPPPNLASSSASVSSLTASTTASVSSQSALNSPAPAKPIAPRTKPKPLVIKPNVTSAEPITTPAPPVSGGH